MMKTLKINPMLLVAACLMVLTSLPAGAATLSFNPLSPTIMVGETVDIDIIVTGLENEDLATFDFDVDYNNLVLSFSGYTLYDGLGVIPADADDWSLGDNGFGSINLAEISYLTDLSNQPDAFILATISLTGLAGGSSALNFTFVDLGDAFGDLIDVSSLGSAAVEVNAVTIPAAAWLLGSGLLGMFGIRRIRK